MSTSKKKKTVLLCCTRDHKKYSFVHVCKNGQQGLEGLLLQNHTQKRTKKKITRLKSTENDTLQQKTTRVPYKYISTKLLLFRSSSRRTSYKHAHPRVGLSNIDQRLHCEHVSRGQLLIGHQLGQNRSLTTRRNRTRRRAGEGGVLYAFAVARLTIVVTRPFFATHLYNLRCRGGAGERVRVFADDACEVIIRHVMSSQPSLEKNHDQL